MSAICSFRSTENKHDIYRGKDCMKKFCEILREHVYICKENFKNKYHKVRDHCHHTGEYIGTAHGICHLKYSVPRKIPIVFHNGSNYEKTMKNI